MTKYKIIKELDLIDETILEFICDKDGLELVTYVPGVGFIFRESE